MILQVGVKALIKRGDTFLFLRRSADFKNGEQAWDIPGGRIEPDEALESALEREVFEETGMKELAVGQLVAAQDIFVEAKDLHVVRLTYTATSEGEVRISDEHSEYRWMTKDEVLSESHIDGYLKEVLESNI